VTYAVAGDTAANHDDASQLSARTPLVLAVVAAVAFCLLLFSFRSVVLPLVSIALNFLSVTAAYGLITVIFQGGRLQGLLGYASSGAITPWVPLFLFTFLFGISMDYHVFILSRIRELRRRGDTTAGAVTAGIASSAGVVSSAALVMVGVFSIFIGMGQVELKMLGIGLAAAILLDATIVRGVLLPAAMTLLGDRGGDRGVEVDRRDRAVGRRCEPGGAGRAGRCPRLAPGARAFCEARLYRINAAERPAVEQWLASLATHPR
jgi:RND superfamily putative drug exporter